MQGILMFPVLIYLELTPTSQMSQCNWKINLLAIFRPNVFCHTFEGELPPVYNVEISYLFRFSILRGLIDLCRFTEIYQLGVI